jgi:hypothetical protein
MNEVHLHLRNDSPSFHPVHPLIRAFGPRDLHHAKGRGRWPRSRSQKRPWSSPMLIRPPSRQSAPAEAHQLLPRSTQNTSIAELPIQRSGFIVDERSCAISFQAVNPLTAPVHPPERVTGPPELHHSEGRYLSHEPAPD